jgi:hypothetical protein
MTGLIGYSFNLLCAMGEYHMVSADVAAAKAYAPAATRMLDWASSILKQLVQGEREKK